MVFAHQRVVDLVLDGPFRQIVLELVEGFNCAAALVISTEAASARDTSDKVLRVQGPVGIGIAGLGCLARLRMIFAAITSCRVPRTL